jgi:CBS-domain-containing membrane protein
MSVLPSGWVWIIGLVAPLLASLVLKKSWDGRIKQAIAMGLSVGLAILVMWIDGSLKTLPLENMAVVLGAVFGSAELMYKQVWQPLILDSPAEKAAYSELKQVLYVAKSVPAITATKTALADYDGKGV